MSLYLEVVLPTVLSELLTFEPAFSHIILPPPVGSGGFHVHKKIVYFQFKENFFFVGGGSGGWVAVVAAAAAAAAVGVHRMCMRVCVCVCMH